MKFFILIIFIALSVASVGQSKIKDTLIIDVIIPFKPVVIQLKRNLYQSKSTPLPNSMRYSYVHLDSGYYDLEFYKMGNLFKTIDSVYLADKQTLALNLKLDGPCLYDYPKNYVPICPVGCTDKILPIVYGLLINPDRKDIHPGGCVITGCDPQYYCAQHKFKF